MASGRDIQPKQLRAEWESFLTQYLEDATIDMEESPTDKAKRIRRLEADAEEWFKYYFPRYCTAPSAEFHKLATERLITHTKWYEVRAWSRELAKSARSMMEILYLALTRQIRNVLLVSNSYDNAERLLLPFMQQLEKNTRITLDYGYQITEGHWEAGEFVARCGCSFRALGAGQSPRGTRNEAARPDFILVDDIDTDEECRNPDRIKQKWDWIEQALIPTVSISGNYRFLFNGNIIAKDCVISRAIKMANHTDIINIRDENGKSSWPEKNSEEDIDAILSKLSTRAAQQEYFNNPINEGEVFDSMAWGAVPPLEQFSILVCYGDPSPSNNKKKDSSMKAVWLLGLLRGNLYVIDGRLDHATNSEFVDWFYDINETVPQRVMVYNYIENNTLQDPMYEQVIKPLFAQKEYHLPIYPDTRKKPDKFARIEGNLQPLHKNGHLILNSAMRDNPHMRRLEEQFTMITPQLPANADGPDCIEGGYYILNHRQAINEQTLCLTGTRPTNRFRI